LSQEFAAQLESVATVCEKLHKLQAKEEKEHQTLWKSRKNLQEQLLNTYNELFGGISAITQDDTNTTKQKQTKICEMKKR